MTAQQALSVSAGSKSIGVSAPVVRLTSYVDAELAGMSAFVENRWPRASNAKPNGTLPVVAVVTVGPGVPLGATTQVEISFDPRSATASTSPVPLKPTWAAI